MDPGPLEKKSVRITIFNQSYTVLTAGEPAEIHELAQTLDELMTRIARSGNMDSTRVAVLAALHLADRLRSLESDLAELKERVDAKSRQFSLLLDQVMEP